jgi:hypothetical protein
LFATATATCGPPGADGTATVRDSAGVAIVENPATAGADGSVWRLSEAPTLDIGTLDGAEEDQLVRVSGVVRLADGRIVVGNGGSFELRFYDADGQFLTTVGREGEGPGEFAGLGMVALFAGGDSIGVYDWRLRRVSVFDVDGTFVRSYPLHFAQGSPSAVGPFEDGRWLCRTGGSFRPGEVAEVWRDTAAYYVFGSDGTLQDSLFAQPWWEMFVQRVGGSSFRARSLPFARGSAHAVYDHGFWTGITDRYEITRYAPDGTPEVIVRKDHNPLRVTAETLEASKAEALTFATDVNVRRETERMYAEAPIAETMPAFSALAVDADGRLWVAEYMPPGADRQEWTVFDADGRIVGAATMPQDFRVRQIGRDFVVGTWMDELDVEHVRMYELIRDAGE